MGFSASNCTGGSTGSKVNRKLFKHWRMCASYLDVCVFLTQTVLISGIAIPANVIIMENFSHQDHIYTTYLKG